MIEEIINNRKKVREYVDYFDFEKLEQYAKITCDLWESGLSLEDIKGRGQTSKVCDVRFVTLWIAYYKLYISQNAIAVYFGYVDHTTVGYGLKKVKALYSSDKNFKKKLDRVLIALQ